MQYRLDVVARKPRVELAEALHDEASMLLVLGEDNSLAEVLPAIDADSLVHECLEHRVDRLLVEHPAHNLRVRDEVGDVLPGLLEVVLKRAPVGLGELVIGDAVVQEARMRLDTQIWNEYVILLGGGLVLVDVSGHAALHLEEVVSIAVHFVGGRGRKPHDKSVEVVENRLVFLEDGAVRLVHDNQVKVRGRVHAHAVVVPHDVDGIQNRWVGGEHDTSVALVLILAQVAARCLGKVLLERARSLRHKCHSVGQEQHVLHAPCAHENVGESGRNASLARARGHHQKPAAVPLVEVRARALDGLNLVVAVRAAAGNLLVHGDGDEGLRIATAIHDALQLVAREDAAHLAHGSALVVHEKGIEAI